MNLRRFILSAVIGAAAVLSAALAPAHAEPVNTGHVTGELHSARAAVAPGERFTVLLRQQIDEGWHTYWRNPGDSGEATDLTWTAPPGFEVGALQWPAPELAPFAGIINFGYHGEVLYPIEVTAPANAQVGRDAVFSVGVYWLVCADICIPEEGTLTLSVPIAAQGRDDPTWAPRAQQALAALPRREDGVSAAITVGAPARLSIVIPDLGETRNPHFFTYDRDVMAHSEPQHPRVGDAGLSFDIPAGAATNIGDVPLEGVVTFEQNVGGQWRRRALEIAAVPGAALPGTDARAATFTDDFPLADLEREGGGAAPSVSMTPAALAAALALALLAGLILNIMPCVLPVLSVKALAFAHGGQSGQARRHGVLYLAGVMATFLALAGALIALRAGGEALGWGFQLQTPWVISALALLFFVIGLNLLGVFEFGAGLQNVGGGLADKGGDAGAFFTGALAVVAATPCTAPFMGGAVGAVLTQSAPVTLLIFAFLALGFALPLTALHFVPGLQKLIPKPGPWMDKFKSVLAFPMLATAALLAWVLAEQTGSGGALALMLAALAIAFAVFVARWGRVWLVVGLITLAVVGAVTWRPLVGAESARVLAEEPWSAERVAALQAEGRPVFVNFTAAWCVTCKVNEGAVLSSARVARAFAASNVAYLKGDWTNRNDAIAAELAAHGRAGVPLYLFYPADGGPPQILPQILTESLILEVIAGGSP
jgi:thiol:disulfide interchange protein DsbD